MQITFNAAQGFFFPTLDYGFAWLMGAGASRRRQPSFLQEWSGLIGGFPDIKEGNGKGGRLSV
jgi:hypothetical protein